MPSGRVVAVVDVVDGEAVDRGHAESLQRVAMLAQDGVVGVLEANPEAAYRIPWRTHFAARTQALRALVAHRFGHQGLADLGIDPERLAGCERGQRQPEAALGAPDCRTKGAVS